MIFRLRYQQQEYELKPGHFVIGRSPECQLCLNDSLVSRRHALITVDGRGIAIEDLGSRNGIQVNGRQVRGRHNLELGDVVGVSYHELSLHGVRGPDATTINHLAPTRPGDIFALLGDLADKALALGRGEEAERLLGIHLLSVLEDASDGKAIEQGVAEQATLYAARLARVTNHGRWFDYPFKLCSSLGATCPTAALDELYVAAKDVDDVDLSLVSKYVGELTDAADGMGPAERFLLTRMQGLERICRHR